MKQLLYGTLLVAITVLMAYSCASTERVQQAVLPVTEVSPPSPDPRVGLGAGLFNAEEAAWNLRLISTTPPPEDFIGSINSDLAFKGNYAIQGNYNGFIVWDISNPIDPKLVVDYLCPASQSDVSVYGDLLFVSGEGLEGRLDCGTAGVREVASPDRLRGIRIFDIRDIHNPEYISNVQTCRGSHTHSVLVDPNDTENIYIYVSGSAPVRPEEEMPECSADMPEDDPDTALFRIEVIKVPLAHPEQSAIVNSPRIFENLEAPPVHGLSQEEQAELEVARARGAYIGEIRGRERIVSDGLVRRFLSDIVESRGGSGEPSRADSAALKEMLPGILAELERERDGGLSARGPNQCHDITLYPEIGLAGGACEGYGLLLDISDPAAPVRIDAVADSNFAYWHSATFNNRGDKVLFTDEWGGGAQPKCRDTDPMEWGANAIFTIEDGKMVFQSYFKLPAPQTATENCVAHNGSLIPVPGRDIMVQSWYQGGINVFDWTDPKNPVEIAFHDRGPISTDRLQMGGSWSAYWYNGFIVSSEIARGLDIFELIPNEFLTENELEAARTVSVNYFNAQGQPRFEWPPSFALARAYVDQLERDRLLGHAELQSIRRTIDRAEISDETEQSSVLAELATGIEALASEAENGSAAGFRKGKLAETLRQLAERYIISIPS